ncbi:hypothetical protein CXF83_10350 [Shewanella sp. Choline-02u-19]|nr:hypothetical protein CXF84_03960 [Shewanella sp. Bg11-22]PKI27103.1 hypothetical protein CXF83_10350 [Shewanella sp. Choline-02u-19]
MLISVEEAVRQLAINTKKLAAHALPAIGIIDVGNIINHAIAAFVNPFISEKQSFLPDSLLQNGQSATTFLLIKVKALLNRLTCLMHECISNKPQTQKSRV